ncbi:MAG TPA: hypothetical protein VF629_21615 [Hymenobacter sp.]|jgi:hypothetical protein|uniref:hypothetical protein n=1 Tax=Hymenobacter sp. TaxID=1898978 RepID=UPI002ED780DC
MKKPAKTVRAILRLVLEEERSKFILVYPSAVAVNLIKVDEHLSASVPQCDYVVILSTQALYVELKGSDVEHAVEQLKSTLFNLKVAIAAKLFFIIHHHCPLPATKIQQMKGRFLKQTGYLLEVRKSPYTHSI